jgi:hypothetical protein
VAGYRGCRRLAARRFKANATVEDSGCPRAAQWLGRRPQGDATAGTPEAGEQPRVPGAAELAGPAGRGRTGLELPDLFRGDGLDNRRMHDILLTRRPPCLGRFIDIVLEGYDSSAAPNSSSSRRDHRAAGMKARRVAVAGRS